MNLYIDDLCYSFISVSELQTWNLGNQNMTSYVMVNIFNLTVIYVILIYCWLWDVQIVYLKCFKPI